MENIQCSSRLLGGLLEVLVYATRNGHANDAQAMLKALRTLRPNFIELNLTESWLLVGNHQYAEAAHVLRELLNSNGAPKIMQFASALMAVCLNAVGDPEWHVHANEVLAQDADPDSVTLVRTLLGVQQAMTDGTTEAAEDASAAAPAVAQQDNASAFHSSYYFTRA